MTMSRLHQQPYHPSKPSALSHRQALTLFVKGFCMGASDVVPGVSGGTMALILGIYEDLIAAIKAFDAAFVRDLLQIHFKKALGAVPLAFLISLGLGILTAIFTLARGLSWLLVHHPVAIWSFFFRTSVGLRCDSRPAHSALVADNPPQSVVIRGRGLPVGRVGTGPYA